MDKADEDGPQRRSTVRVDVARLPVEMWVSRLMAWEYAPAHIINLSAGGALVEHKVPLPLAMDVRMRFRLPDSDELLSIGAAVVRTQKSYGGIYHLGMRFVFPQEGRRDRITRWVFAELARRHREWLDHMERIDEPTEQRRTW